MIKKAFQINTPSLKSDFKKSKQSSSTEVIGDQMDQNQSQKVSQSLVQVESQITDLNENLQKQNVTSKSENSQDFQLQLQSGDYLNKTASLQSAENLVIDGQLLKKQVTSNHLARTFTERGQTENFARYLTKKVENHKTDFKKQKTILESAHQVEQLKAHFTPLDQVIHIQTVGIPEKPNYYVKISLVILNSKGPINKNKISEERIQQEFLTDQEIIEQITINKTNNHNNYECFTAIEDKDTDQKGKGILKKTQDFQFRFESDWFHFFEVYESDRLVDEWVLYDWKLLGYIDDSQDQFRVSLDTSQLYFFAYKEDKDDFMLFVLTLSQLVSQSTQGIAKVKLLDEIVKTYKIENLPKYVPQCDVIGDRFVWKLIGEDGSNLVLTQLLCEGAQQFYYYISATTSYSYSNPIEENNCISEIKLKEVKSIESKVVTYRDFQPYQKDLNNIQENIKPFCQSRFYSNYHHIELYKQRKKFSIERERKYEWNKFHVTIKIDWLVLGNRVLISGDIQKLENHNYKIYLWEFSKDGLDTDFDITRGQFHDLPNLKSYYFKLNFDIDVSADTFELRLISLNNQLLLCELKFEISQASQILIVQAYPEQENEGRLIQSNKIKSFVTQYPIQIQEMPFQNSILITTLDINQSSIFLNFPEHKIFYLGENFNEPFQVVVLLESIHEPQNLQVARIFLGFRANDFKNCEVDIDPFIFLADVLIESSDTPSNILEIKSVVFNQAFEKESIDSPILQLIKFSTLEREEGYNVYYIWTCHSLLQIDCGQNHFEKWIARDNINKELNVPIIKTQEDKLVLTLPVIGTDSFSFCIRVLKNQYHWIGQLDGYADAQKILEIPHGKQVISLKAMKGDFFQYLCDDGVIYDKKGTQLFQCNVQKSMKFYVWGERSLLYLRNGKLICFLFHTKKEVDLTVKMTPPNSKLVAMYQVEGTNKIQMLLEIDGRRFSCIKQYFDSSQVMLVNPYLVSRLSDEEGISNISFYKEKCLVQMKKNCLIYDLVTGMNLCYFQLPDESYKLDIQDNILYLGGFKYLLDQMPRCQKFQGNEVNNTLFFGTGKYICVTSHKMQEGCKGVLTLTKQDTPKFFNCEIVQDVNCTLSEFTNTKSYMVWRSQSKVFSVNILKQMKRLSKSFENSMVIDLEEGELCKEINLQDLYGKRIIKSIQSVSQQFIEYLANDCTERNIQNKRTQVIQILFEDYALVWDCDDHEEILVTERNKQSYQFQLVSQEFQRSNFDQSLVVQDLINDQKPFEKKILRQFYSPLDLILLTSYLEDKKIEDVEQFSISCNIYGETFFTLTARKDFNQFVEGVIKNLVDRSASIQKNYPDYFENILKIMLTKSDFNDQTLSYDPFMFYICNYLDPVEAKHFNIPTEKVSEKCTILQKTIWDKIDKKRFRVMLQLALLGKIKHSNIINDIAHLDILLEINDQYVKQFLNQGYIENVATKSVKILNAFDQDDLISFSSNTTMISEQVIREKFKQAVFQRKGFLGLLNQLLGLKFTTLVENYVIRQANRLSAQFRGKMIDDIEKQTNTRNYKVMIFSIEFLENKIIQFLGDSVQNREHFDFEIIKILVDELVYPWSITIFVFFPYLIYCCLLTYYFSYCLTEAEYHRGSGFMQGKTNAIAIRIVILTTTAYFLIIEAIQIQKETNRLYRTLIDNIGKLQMFALNIWIIVEHATGFSNCDPIRLSQIAAVEMLQLWYFLFFWLRIFDQTAIYVELIEQVVMNTRFFILMLVVILCTFGFATLVLDRQMQQQTLDEYQTYDNIVIQYFDSYTFNVIFGQYLLGLGLSDTSHYGQNPSRQLLWIFFILQTFLTQITFFNMLISVMSTTYEVVIQYSVRNKLIMRTQIYSEYAGFLNYIEKQIPEKFSRRYFYIAIKQDDDDTKTDSELIHEISKALKENSVNIQTKFIDSQQQVKDLSTKIGKQIKDQQAQINKITEQTTQIAEQNTQIMKLLLDILAKQ